MKAGVIMKKTMQKLTAALIALACLPVTGLTASADVPWYWGSTTWAAFEDMETFDDHGKFVNSYAKGYLKDPDGIRVYLRNSAQPSVIVASPRENIMRFVLREDVDIDDAAKQMAEVLDVYFPGIKDGLNEDYYKNNQNSISPSGGIIYTGGKAELFNTMYGERVFELQVLDPDARTTKLETSLLLTFAQRHLISECYGWGNTADYMTGYYENELLQAYPSFDQIYDNETKKTMEVKRDWEAIQAYLTEHYPGMTLESYESEEKIDRIDQDGNVNIEPLVCYRINGAEEMTVREKVELDCELWEKFGISTRCGFLESTGAPVTGHNALEQHGDTNLDCEVDILDVIAANKHILGVGTLDKTGLKNADMDGNGTADAEDSLAILKAALDIAD